MLTQPAQNKSILFLFIIGLGLICAGFFSSGFYYQDKILPNTLVNTVDISGKTKDEAVALLLEKLPQETGFIPNSQVIRFVVDDIVIETTAEDIELKYDYETAVVQALQESTKLSVVQRALKVLQQQETQITITPTYSNARMTTILSELAKNVDISGKISSVSLQKRAILVFPGEPNRKVEIEKTLQLLTKKITTQADSTEPIIIESVVSSPSAVLSSQEIITAEERAKKLIGAKLILETESKKSILTDAEIISFLKPEGGINTEILKEKVIDLSEQFAQPQLSAKFEYDPKTLEVSSFTPHQNGIEVNEQATTELLLTLIDELEKNLEEKNSITAAIPYSITKPEKTLAETNSIGINEQIGFGESSYTGSIPNRIHNVGITSDKISLTLVPPKKEFSFNKTLGEVSSRTGYKSAYVISGGRTILGDGGGVCQVSSTLFRAVLNAGLDVTKRLQHSYRVSYYELNSDPGFDATVYSGEVDFRFINDTEHYILIESTSDAKTKYMNVRIYGTSDGRTAEITNYKKWDARAPLPTEYYPSTDLPTGKLQQIDWAVGGIKTEFTHTVKNKDGSIRQKDTYYSNYRPWSAKYLRGV